MNIYMLNCLYLQTVKYKLEVNIILEKIITYIFSFLWGICILFSLIGWGGMVNRIVLHTHRFDWGIRAALGIALSVFIGGFLNLTWLISSKLVIFYLGIGLSYCLYDLHKNKNIFFTSLSAHIKKLRNDSILIAGVALILFMVFLRYANSVSSYKFNWYDDWKTYINFPVKMLQTGSIGEDPFHTSRLMATLGGQAFLQTFVLSVLSERNLDIIDAGIGLIAVLGLLLGYLRKKKASEMKTVLILILFLSLSPPKVNIASLMTGVALFLGLFRILDCDELENNHFAFNALIIALFTSAICAMKSTFIPACASMFFLSYIFYICSLTEKRKAIYEFILAFILSFSFLMPWMISMYKSSGTLLYPIFGKGYLHKEIYQQIYLGAKDSLFSIQKMLNLLDILFSPVWTYMLYSLIIPFLLVSLTYVGSREWKLVARESSLSLMISSGIGTIIIAYFISHTALRFSFPIILTALFIIIIDNLNNNKIKNNLNFLSQNSKFITMIAIGMIIQGLHYSYSNKINYKDAGISKRLYITCIKNIVLGNIFKNFVSDEEREQYAKMQQSIPKGESLLAVRVFKPFLLNFNRNKIFLINQPGTSPPPGMPFYEGSQALADYLKSKSIRYIACSYAKKNYDFWSKPNVDLDNNLQELARTKKIYDDGTTFILDLSIDNKKLIS